MTRFRRDLDNSGCCNNWKNGIRTINGQYPDDNRDFDINAGAGILISPATGGITITNTTDPAALEAGQNIELTPNGDHLQIGTTDDVAIVNDLSIGGAAAVTGDASVGGDTTLNGDLSVNGNIYNQGASYESHMEQVFTENDYIIMRDNAVTGLGSGDYSGFQVKLYDGVNDGRLVIDNSGTARVGDVGDEQPLLTREESADLTDGDVLTWDATNSKAVGVPIDTSPVSASNNPISSGAVYTANTSHSTTFLTDIAAGVSALTQHQVIVKHDNIVTFNLYFTTTAAQTANTVLFKLPTGFIPFTNVSIGIVGLDNTRSVMGRIDSGGNILNLWGLAANANYAIMVSFVV